MNKSKIIVCAIGGLFLVAAGALGYFAYDAFSRKSAALVEGDANGNDGLDSIVRQIASLSAKNPYPSPENARRIAENRQAVADWITSVREIAARGDWCPDAACTPAQFKEQIVREAKLFLSHTGAGGVPILPPEFSFGSFRDYLGEKMPPRDRLARLQRQWYDLTSLLTLLETNGVRQVSDAQVVERAAADAAPADGRKPKRPVRPAAGEKEPSVETYKLTFLALPASFIRIVRDLSFRERFTVVDDFTFARERDAVSDALGGDKQKESAAKGGRTRPRGRARGRDRDASEDEKSEDETPKGPVFDPEKDSFLKVDLTVSVYDFRTLEDDEKGGAK